MWLIETAFFSRQTIAESWWHSVTWRIQFSVKEITRLMNELKKITKNIPQDQVCRKHKAQSNFRKSYYVAVWVSSRNLLLYIFLQSSSSWNPPPPTSKPFWPISWDKSIQRILCDFFSWRKCNLLSENIIFWIRGDFVPGRKYHGSLGAISQFSPKEVNCIDFLGYFYLKKNFIDKKPTNRFSWKVKFREH